MVVCYHLKKSFVSTIAHFFCLFIHHNRKSRLMDNLKLIVESLRLF